MLHSLVNEADNKQRRIRDDDATKDFVKSLINDELMNLRSRFQDFDLATSSRLHAAEEALMRSEQDVRRMREEETQQATQLVDAASGSATHFERALDKVEAAISGLLHDLKQQDQELARWRQKFRRVGLDSTGDDDGGGDGDGDGDAEGGRRDLRQVQHRPSLPQRVARFESRMRAAEAAQRELLSQHERERGYLDVDVRESIRVKDFQAVDGKLQDVDRAVAAFSGRFVEWERRAATDEVVMRTHARLVQKMQDDRAAVRRQLGTLKHKTHESVRYLQAGLDELYATEGDVQREVDRVRVALARGIVGRVPIVMT